MRFKNEASCSAVSGKGVNYISMNHETNLVGSKQSTMNKQKLFIIKIGGNVIDSQDALQSFLKDFSTIGAMKILIHGGGKVATRIGEQLGIESKYTNGRRITDDATIDLVTMVYGGLVNKKIVAQLQALKTNAVGLSGADANCIPAGKRPVKEVDYGWVGDVEAANVEINTLKLLLENGLVPVFAPLTHDGHGHILNTNADTIASSLAVALSACYDVRLIYCFEKKGILEDVDDQGSVIRLIDKQTYRDLLSRQKLFAGILPKIDNAFAAIDAGVNEVLVGDAGDLVQNTTPNTSGTLFIK
jgi:acetylglutamate kinase